MADRARGRDIRQDVAPTPLVIASLVVVAASVAVLALLEPLPPVAGWPYLFVAAAVLVAVGDHRRTPVGQGKEAGVTISAAVAVIIASTFLLPAWAMPGLVVVAVLAMRKRWRHSVVNAALQILPIAAAVLVLQAVTLLAPGLPPEGVVVVGGILVCVAWWAVSGAAMALILWYVEGMPLRGTPVFGPEPNRVISSQLVLGLVSGALIRESWWYVPLAAALVVWAFSYFRLFRRASTSGVDRSSGLVGYDVLREACYHEQERSRRSGDPLALVIFDIHEFRAVNAAHGYEVGDAVIGHVARTLSGELAQYDVLARFGGEEFIALMTDTTAAQAASIAVELQLAVGGSPYAAPSGPVSVQLSAGVTDLRPDEPLDDALLRLERALYEAKGIGPGRVVTAGE
jgi:diguanylate cyclase (GGDEF)-like protein